MVSPAYYPRSTFLIISTALLAIISVAAILISAGAVVRGETPNVFAQFFSWWVLAMVSVGAGSTLVKVRATPLSSLNPSLLHGHYKFVFTATTTIALSYAILLYLTGAYTLPPLLGLTVCQYCLYIAIYGSKVNASWIYHVISNTPIAFFVLIFWHKEAGELTYSLLQSHYGSIIALAAAGFFLYLNISILKSGEFRTTLYHTTRKRPLWQKSFKKRTFKGHNLSNAFTSKGTWTTQTGTLIPLIAFILINIPRGEWLSTDYIPYIAFWGGIVACFLPLGVTNRLKSLRETLWLTGHRNTEEEITRECFYYAVMPTYKYIFLIAALLLGLHFLAPSERIGIALITLFLVPAMTCLLIACLWLEKLDRLYFTFVVFAGFGAAVCVYLAFWLSELSLVSATIGTITVNLLSYFGFRSLCELRSRHHYSW